ncbi:MAG: hypothetical protein EPN85_03760 [Bacteroidetes bacterium]|nr:MAG: hypothetical protein EPN85_03760 [Bacteroidota bacterium]
MRSNKKNILLYISGILFFALYVLLARNNRLPFEDYHFISLTQDMGAIKAMQYIYEVYSARWSAHTIAFSLSVLYDNAYFLFLFNIGTLAALFVSLCLAMKSLFNGIVEFNLPKNTLLVYTVLFTTSFFFSSYNIGESWFWYMVNWMYMWSIIAGNLLMWLLLSEKTTPIRILAITVITAYIAGAAESYALIYILLLALMIVLKKQNAPFTGNIQIRSVYFALTLLVLFYMITILAPGTWARKDGLTDATFAEHVIMVLKAYGKVLLQTPALIPYLLIFGIPWVILGNLCSSEKKETVNGLLTIFLKSLVFMGMAILVLILPASWILYDLPPARALSQVSLLLTIYVSFLFFYIGYKIQLPQKFRKWTATVAMIAGIAVITFHLTDQYKVTGNFSKDYDGRITRIKREESTGRKNTLYFERLSPSGMLYSDEISSDSSLNKYFEKLCSPNFHVAVKKIGQNKP